MKSIFASLAILFVWASTVSGQIYNPVKWDHKSVKTGDNTYDVIYQAMIEDGWNIYTQYLANEDGPIATSFNYDEGDFSLKGKNEECDFHRKEVFDKLFDMKLVKYSKKAIFRQTIKTDSPEKPITGYLEFMTCDEEKCLPPAQIDFTLDLSKSLDAKAINYTPASLCKDEVKFVAVAPQKIDEDKAKTIIGRVDKKKDDAKSNVDKKVAQKTPSTVVKKDQKPVSQPTAPISINGISDKSDQGGFILPVHWTSSITRKSNGQAEVEMKAKIDKGWHIYSTKGKNEDAPVTILELDESDSYAPNGDIKESAEKVVESFDKNFDMVLVKYKKSASFSQLIDVKNDSKPIKGFLEYIACTNSKCLTPQLVEFEAYANTSTIKIGDELLDGPLNTGGLEKSELEKMYQVRFDDLQEPIGACIEEVKEEDNSLWTIFTLGFIGGLLALLTPCVFPMIPLTVSFFTKSAEKKGKGLFNAVFYGLSILLVYVLISVPFHLLDTVNPNILNDISTNVWLNLAFFFIFLFFAFSFFGYFDLTLPSSVTNKISAAEGVGGIIGIFFMALTLALVSFSCTGPILGSLLAGSLSGDGGAWQLTSGFAGFGLALGLPFGLFAAFPSMMNKLPKSGGWLTTVKVVLGFLELALAFKFLSNADLVNKWGLLKIEPFLIIWILIAIGMALYLFGKLKFPHDSPIKKLSPVRMGLGVLSVAAAIYLMTGFRYNEETGTFRSLKLLSGLAPPVGYSWIYKNDCPHNLDCFKDWNEGLEYAQKVNKPILLDFTGHACVNCRKMEEHVWPDQAIFPLIKDDYVLISLYVDEKIALPKEEQVTLPRRSGGSQKMRTVGNKWAFFQSEYFNINAQPYYVLLSPDGKYKLNNSIGYTDAETYTEFLECGLRNYKQLGQR